MLKATLIKMTVTYDFCGGGVKQNPLNQKNGIILLVRHNS